MSAWIVLSINYSRYQSWQVSVLIWSIELTISCVSLKSDNITCVEMSYVLATAQLIYNDFGRKEACFSITMQCSTCALFYPFLSKVHYPLTLLCLKTYMLGFFLYYCNASKNIRQSSFISLDLKVTRVHNLCNCRN